MTTPRPDRPTHSSRRPRAGRGFSVLEMLVVMAVIGILSLIGMIGLRQVFPKMTLRNTAKETALFLQQARIMAIRNGSFTVVTVETEPSDAASWDEIESQWLVLNAAGLDGALEYRNSYQLPNGNHPVFLWGHDENEPNGASANTFPDGKIIFTPAGKVQGVGALRLSYPKPGPRNTIEVAIRHRAGLPVMRKYILSGDRVNASQEYYQETMATDDSRNLWIWY